MNEQTTVEIRDLTMGEIRALPGLLGRIAAIKVERAGSYGYIDASTGRKVLIRLVKEPQA